MSKPGVLHHSGSRVIDNFADVVRTARPAGTLRDDLDPTAAARLLATAAKDGIRAQWLLEPSVDMAAELGLLGTLMLRRR